jgi:hypothetical protein
MRIYHDVRSSVCQRTNKTLLPWGNSHISRRTEGWVGPTAEQDGVNGEEGEEEKEEEGI